MSYKLAGVIWNDDGTMATKKPSPLEVFKRFRNNFQWIEENVANLKGYFENEKLYFKEDLDIIETTLKRLKTFEEELGIDLITLSKALQQDYIWVREHNTKEKEVVCERIRLNYNNRTLDFVEPRKEIGKGRNLFDYGESWALTKEELEYE